MLAGAVVLTGGVLAGAVLRAGLLLIRAVVRVGRLLAPVAVHARATLLGRVVLLRVPVLAGAVLLSLAVLGARCLLACAAVQVLAALLAGAVLLRARVLARGELSVAGLRLRPLVLARPVLAGGLLSGPGLITGAVLQGGDELTNAELCFAFLLSLAVPGIVILLTGSMALTRRELPRLTVLSTGRLLVGGVLTGAVLRLRLLLAGLLLPVRVLGRFEVHVTSGLEPAELLMSRLRVNWPLTNDVVLAGAVVPARRVLARPERRTGLLLRLFIATAALLCVRGLLAAVSVHARPGLLADGPELRLLGAGGVLPAGARLTRVNGEVARLAAGEWRELTVARRIGDVVGVVRLVATDAGAEAVGSDVVTVGRVKPVGSSRAEAIHALVVAVDRAEAVGRAVGLAVAVGGRAEAVGGSAEAVGRAVGLAVAVGGRAEAVGGAGPGGGVAGSVLGRSVLGRCGLGRPGDAVGGSLLVAEDVHRAGERFDGRRADRQPGTLSAQGDRAGGARVARLLDRAVGQSAAKRLDESGEFIEREPERAGAGPSLPDAEDGDSGVGVPAQTHAPRTAADVKEDFAKPGQGCCIRR